MSGTRPEPTARRLRPFYAYWITVRVIVSYLAVRFWARFRGHDYFQRALQARHIANARRVEAAILRLQGLFIKVGQLFSIMTNFLPEEFRQQLEGLQDAVPPVDYDHIRRRFEEEFGSEPDRLFASFDRQAIASASMSQVHRATLPSGEEVAVKVQYPDVERLVRSDLKTFRRILRLTSFFFPYQGADVMFREISQMLRAELDFSEEARQLEAIRDNFVGCDYAHFPRVFHELSTSRILTTEFLQGTKVTHLAELEAQGIDRASVARLLIDMYCRQIFIHGLYHADPHPGNIFVLPGPRLALVDFGAVASVSPAMRRGIVEFLQGVLNQDSEKIIRAMKGMGFVSRRGIDDERVFDRVVDYFHQQFQQSIQLENFNLREIRIDPEIGLQHLVELRNLDIGLRDLANAFVVPNEWIRLQRTLLLLTGLCTLLDESIQPMDHIRPFIEEFVLGEDRDWSGFVLKTTKEIGLEYLSIPAAFKRFLSRASHGQLEFSVRRSEEQNRRLYALGHQLIYTLLGATSVVLAAVFHLQREPSLAQVSLYSGCGFGVLLLLSMLRSWRR